MNGNLTGDQRWLDAFPKPVPLFERGDWASFWITVALTLTVYLFTLAPQVTLEFSGLLSTSALYAGVPQTPGYPLWTLYAWSFTKLLPFGNIAWRVAISSAVAAAMACGIVALLVTRGSALLLAGFEKQQRLPGQEEALLRKVCGIVAGAGFGFHRDFWKNAVIVEMIGLSMLLLAVVLYLLFHWKQSTGKAFFLYASFLTYGLALTVQLSLVVALPGLMLILLLKNPSFGRDFAFVLGTALMFLTLAREQWIPAPISSWMQLGSLRSAYFVTALIALLICGVLAFITRRLMTHWRPVGLSTLLFILGLFPYFYLPLASMSNPPVNWGYTRSIEGWVHSLGRGQYESILLDCHPFPLARDCVLYAKQTVHDVGWLYLSAALVLPATLFKLKGCARRWILGLIATFLSLSLLMLKGLNLSAYGVSAGFAGPYFIASHLVVIVMAGHGLAVIGTTLARRGSRPRFLSF